MLLKNSVIKGKFTKDLLVISYNSVVKLHGKKIGEPQSHNMTVLYPDKCFKKSCFKGTACCMNIVTFV